MQSDFDGDKIVYWDIEGASISMFKDVDFGVDSAEILNRLIQETPWCQESITVYGKTYPQPRLIAWYGLPYQYSGLKMTINEWTPLLKQLRIVVESLTGHTYNSALLNYYRDGQDSIGMHSDNEKELGKHPVIASLSFGAERTFVLKKRHFFSPQQHLNITLPDSSLLVMKGATQQNYQHGIPKTKRVKLPRVNITFRNIILSA